MKFLQIFGTLVLVGLLSLCTSCGVYTFNPKGQSSIQSISVERLDNQTPEFGLADHMTDDIIDALINDGTLRVVAAENADAILSGNLMQYDRRPHEFTTEDEVISYAVVMVFEISLTEHKTGNELWKERVSQQGIYNVADETEEGGQQKAIELLVEAVINKMTKSW